MRDLGPLDAVPVIAADVAARAGPTVLGIDGHSAAGKSTLAGALAAACKGVVIGGDDFYRPMDPADRARLTPEQGAALYYDWERLRREVLEPLRRGDAATFNPYDWPSNSLSATTASIEPAEVIVVEGLFVSRPELADLIDIAVLVESPPATRRRRQRERGDSSISWIERWDAAEVWYFQHARPPETFDYRVGDAGV